MSPENEIPEHSERPRETVKRLARDWRTMGAMMRIYCRDYHGDRRAGHGKGELCGECADLLAYTGRKLDGCPYGAGKPTCGKCRDYCFETARLEEIRRVMCYAGALMWWEHPVLSARHLVDSWHDTRSSGKQTKEAKDKKIARAA